MSKNSKSTNNEKENLKKTKKAKPMKNSKIETLKTITIAVLLASIVAFLAGMKYESTKNEMVKAEAANIVKNVKVEVDAVEASKQ